MSENAASIEESLSSAEKITVVVNKGTFSINGTAAEVKDLTSALLERIVSMSLEGKAFFTIEGDSPIADFFKTLRDGTQDGSELKELYKSTLGSSEEDSESGIPSEASSSEA